MKTTTLFGIAALAGALAFASDSRAQSDTDFLTTSVPPNVVIQFDTSGSMKAVIQPPEYKELRAASPALNDGTPAAEEPAVGYSTTYTRDRSGVDYRPKCSIYRNGSQWNRCQAIEKGSNSTSPSWTTPQTEANSKCYGDTDASAGSWLSAGDYMRCWDVPDLCDQVEALGFGCSFTPDARRYKGSTSYDSVDRLDIILPNWSYTPDTTFPPYYLWWVTNELLRGNTPPVIDQDRNKAAKVAVEALVNAINVTGQPAKVKFGLARYSSTNNGGYIVEPVALDNKTQLLETLNAMPASGSTPLSETLVDVGRYFAGAEGLGQYAAYSRELDGDTDGDDVVPPSPIANGCEKNFVIVVTDGLPTADCHHHHVPGFAASIGDYDGVAGDVPAGQCMDADGSEGTTPGDDGATNWLDDIAKYLHDNDLRPDIIGKQNIFTYTVGFNVDGTLLQDAANLGHGRYENASNATDLADSLIEAVEEILLRNSSFSSATVPSTRTAFGDGFYTAYFMPGGDKGVWRGHLEAYRLSPSLDVLDADGQIALDPITNEFVDPRNPFWDAAETVLADYDQRSLYTTIGGVRTALPVLDPNTPITDPNDPLSGLPAALGLSIADEAQYPHFATQPDLIDSDWELAAAVVNWVHGFDSFNEDEDATPVPEPREWVFGDVFHSNPVAVGPAMPFLRNEPGYGPATDTTSFMGMFNLRQRVLYVGANDGMVHAFAAGSYQPGDPNTTADDSYSGGDGTELFGYVPGFLLDRIKELPQNDTGKLFYVDGSGSAADVVIDDGDGVREGSDWTTALVMPMRQGGEGLIALDVTDPNASTAPHGPYPRLMWEFTHADLGETWSRPILTRVKLRTSSGGDRCGQNDGDGNCEEVWVAIFGAGYRVEGDPNMSTQYTDDPNAATYTEKGRGVYIVRVSNGQILARLQQIQGDAIFDDMRYAIPAEPAVLDTNFDGFADVVYIGDLGGQLWKWDLSAPGVISGSTVPTSSWPAGVLFKAPVATVAGGLSHYHSIFQSAAAAYVRNVLTLSFASGERTDMAYIGEADPNDPNDIIGLYDDNNRFWVLKDPVPTGSGAFPSDLPIVEAPDDDHPVLTDITNLPEDNDLTDAGYFFRVQDGEKFISNHLIFGGVTLTLSYVPAELAEEIEPDPGEEAEVCTISGQTNQWAWNLETGGGTLQDPDDADGTVRSLVLGNGAPTDPRLTISKDLTGNMVIKITAQTSTGAIANPDPPPNSLDLVDLIYWRQNF